MNDAQQRALEAVRLGRIYVFPSSGVWCKYQGIHGTTLKALLRNGLIELEPAAGEPWANAKLTSSGEEALKERVA